MKYFEILLNMTRSHGFFKILISKSILNLPPRFLKHEIQESVGIWVTNFADRKFAHLNAYSSVPNRHVVQINVLDGKSPISYKRVGPNKRVGQKFSKFPSNMQLGCV